MPEALARMRREPSLSVSAREAASVRRPPPAPESGGARSRFWFVPRSFGGFVAILFAVVLGGVIVNAVGLQHERHRAPLFGPDPAPAAAPPAAAPTPTPVPMHPATRAPEAVPSPTAAAPRFDNPPLPVARPQTAPKKGDVIGDLIKTGGVTEPSKDIAAAQRALIKLGYDIEADGAMGADTEKALRDFEKKHGLPLTSEITPKLLAKLNAAAR